MNSLDTDQYTAVFSELDSTPEYDLIDYTAIYDEVWSGDVPFIDHMHRHFIIPAGDIDGVNKQFALYGKQFEVLLNGLNIPYTAIPGGFILIYAPSPGDYLWADVIV